MYHDAQGLAVTTDDPETVADIDRLLARQANQRLDGTERVAVFAAAYRDPAPLPNTVAAILSIHAGEKAKAAHYLGRARVAQST